MDFVLFAEVTENLAGGGGWAGAGLLGLVLCWLLLKHLPDKDKQLMDMMVRYDTRQESLQTTFRNAIDSVIKHCDDENKQIIIAFREELDKMKVVKGVSLINP